MTNKETKKRERVLILQDQITELRKTYRNDMKSSDPKKRATALVVALIDKTYERVGNKESAEEREHYGVTTWLSKHVTLRGNKATIQYVGKSGVKQKKTVEDSEICSELKKLKKGLKPDEAIFRYEYNDGTCPVAASDVNEYLEPYGVTAKDLRGFHANSEMTKELKKLRNNGKTLPEDKKEKEKILKKEFKTALDIVAEKLGHDAATLRGQYLLENFEDTYMKTGKPSLEKLARKVALRYASKNY